MKRSHAVRWLVVPAAIVIAGAAVNTCVPPIAAGGLLHPARTINQHPRPERCGEAEFAGADVALKGWRCRADGEPKGTLIYLHGVADNRGSAIGAIERFSSRGYDVIAYDSRAHGDSEGAACTYGYFEKHDLMRVIDSVEHQPVAIVGTSLGAAVALQTAALDPRVSAVVAAETFSDLRTVAEERAPWILTSGLVDRAFRVAEEQARFQVHEVSPMASATQIRVPVLLIHGANDRETSPAHSERVFSALPGPKRLIRVEGAGHNGSLRGDSVWTEIDAFIEQSLHAAPRAVPQPINPKERL